jgi:hypothetical protein
LIRLQSPKTYAQTARLLQISRFRVAFTKRLICAGARHPADSKSYPDSLCQVLFDIENSLDHEALDLVLEGADLAHEVGGLVGGDAAADDSAADTAGTAKSHLAGDVNLEEKSQYIFT